MNCKKCGAELTKGDLFCKACGEKTLPKGKLKTPWLLNGFFISCMFLIAILNNLQPLGLVALLLLFIRFMYDKNKYKALNLNGYISDLERSIEKTKDKLSRLEDEETDILDKKETLKNDISKLKFLKDISLKQLNDISTEINIYEEINNYKSLEKELSTLQIGIYKKEYSFDISEEYQVALKNLRIKLAEYVKMDKAVHINRPDFLKNDSKKTSDKVLNNASKLILRAFNNECDAIIAKITAKNIENSRKRIETSFNQINKLGEYFGISITPSYLKLKIKEVKLTYEYEIKRQEELEEQKAIKEQMREEAKVQAEIVKLEKEAIKEEELYRKALESARQELDSASEAEKLALENKIRSLEENLHAAEEKMQRAKSMAEQTKSGFVYIISNVGSFGEDVYKIGMTRRLDPLERVNELSNASVPFPFDIHATIYTHDAPALETKLHQEFDAFRLNKVNNRKEFFKVDIDSILDKVIELHGDFKLTKQAEAYQYRQSLINNVS